MLFIARLKACPYCGNIHKGQCPKKPKDYHVKQDKIRKFRKSSEWTNKRKEILERDEYCCQICKAQGRITSSKSLHVHHIHALVNDWENRANDRNLICLCSEHHHDIHNGMFNTADIQELVNKKYND